MSSDDDDVPLVARLLPTIKVNDDIVSNLHALEKNNNNNGGDDDDDDDVPLIARSCVNVDKYKASKSKPSSSDDAPKKEKKKRTSTKKKETTTSSTINDAALADSVRGDGSAPPAAATATAVSISKTTTAAATVTKKKLTTTSAAAAAGGGAGAAAAGKEKERKITDETTVQNMISDFFARARKPAVSQGVVDALGSKVSKTFVQRGLDALLETQRITKKDFKKISVYFPIVQPREPESVAAAAVQEMSSEEKAELEQLTATLTDLSDECAALDKEVKAKKQLLQTKSGETPIQSVENNFQQLKLELEELKEKIREVEMEEDEKNNEDAAAAVAANGIENNNNDAAVAAAGRGNNKNNKKKTNANAAVPLNETHERFLSMSLPEMVRECQRMRQLMYKRRALSQDMAERFCGDRRPRDVHEELGLQSEVEIRGALKIGESEMQLIEQVFSL